MTKRCRRQSRQTTAYSISNALHSNAPVCHTEKQQSANRMVKLKTTNESNMSNGGYCETIPQETCVKLSNNIILFVNTSAGLVCQLHLQTPSNVSQKLKKSCDTGMKYIATQVWNRCEILWHRYEIGMKYCDTDMKYCDTDMIYCHTGMKYVWNIVTQVWNIVTQVWSRTTSVYISHKINRLTLRNTDYDPTIDSRTLKVLYRTVDSRLKKVMLSVWSVKRSWNTRVASCASSWRQFSTFTITVSSACISPPITCTTGRLKTVTILNMLCYHVFRTNI